jgi:hypothetical protein
MLMTPSPPATFPCRDRGWESRVATSWIATRCPTSLRAIDFRPLSVAALEARHGAERTARILGLDRFNNLIFPNISLNAQYHQLRVVEPVAAERTIVAAARPGKSTVALCGISRT